MMNGHLPLLPKKQTLSRKTYDLLQSLTYDEKHHQYISKDGSIYQYIGVNRQGYRQYKNKQGEILRITIYKPYFDYVRELRLSEYGKTIYSKRKETIERVFADFKERHFGRYTHYRGLKKVSDHTLLIFASMNMKKMANYLAKVSSSLSRFISKLLNLSNKKHYFQLSSI